MKSTCKELRNRAWKSLEGRYWSLLLLSVVVIVIYSVASSVTAGVLGLLALPLLYALDVAFLQTSRDKQVPSIESLFYVYRDNLLKSFLVVFLMMLFISLWSILFVIPGIIMAYAYAMSVYIANDHPELSAMEAIKKSKELMRGHKWDLFVLDLSFIGWILLCCITCGLGFIFLVPYIEMTHAEFYRELTDKAEVVEAIEA